MVVGFTGTRAGLNTAQVEQLSLVLGWLARCGGPGNRELHHGGAIGADRQAHRAAGEYAIHVHPCPGVVRDFGEPENYWYQVFPPLVRNRNIVEACDVLIAAPLTDKEELRSGTWATIRYCRAAGKPVVMLSRGKI